ncbi:probable E3 ubiquitin-protein ligase makorin-1 isoform X1 [Brienomyrus brachyistius]|uniref:probable E3 ubiquitin-protein ligase makorin-1 isoform X1 n=2 Tax=Brienomyrus brachyistius TaxID=42636 RepID=UPI0020B38F41|nr:probable E3 ubiquitin-protein ligase makorin-1 isoform X1 [Brienomyrus brachyistius]
MAEAAAASAAAPALTGGSWTKHVTCRYFMHGVCKEGNNCRYSHELTSSKPAMICKYFQRGCCAYGDHCRYDHAKPAKQEELEAPSLPAPLPPAPVPLAPALAAAPEPRPSGMGGPAKPSARLHSSGAVDWVHAAEFVPGQPYCGRATNPTLPETPGLLIEEEYEKERAEKELKKQLCPYAAVGECRYGLNCAYLHGDVCDMCGLQVLHPFDTAQRSQHIKACIEAHEKDMEISFAIQRSKDMMCGVCMEVVFEKANPSDRRFGILSNCSHCYCLKCIRKWRSAKQFESKIIKSCPECRITSNFVIPSEYWVEDKEEKQKLIQKYKDGMGSKPCRYFDEGRGSCPFGANCFYKHAYPDGRLEEAHPQRRPAGSSGRSRSSRRTPLWDLLDERESGDSFENEEEEMVTFELSEMLLMLLAAGTDDDATDSEDEWDLFHEELDDYYEVYL